MKFKDLFKNQLNKEADAWIEKIDEELCKALKLENILDANSNCLTITFIYIQQLYAVYIDPNDSPNTEIGRIRESVLKKKVLPHLKKEGFSIVDSIYAGEIHCHYEAETL